MRIFLLQSEGMQVTQWLHAIVQQLPHYEIVDNLDACDVIGVRDLTTNHHSRNMSFLSVCLRGLASTCKPIIVFVHDDPDEQMVFSAALVANVLMFRTSLRKSLRQPYERLLPSFQCQTMRLQPLPPLVVDTHAPIPIGFVGALTHQDRKYACELLQTDPRFNTHFVFRSSFHGHFNDVQKQQNKNEYMHNLQNNIYQLCCRGSGNFSHRFYEVLASGRVPVLPDSDLVFLNHIPPTMWRNCVVVASNIATIPDAVYAFHWMHDMVQVQKDCREMWIQYFSFQGYASYFDEQVQECRLQHSKNLIQ